MDGTEEPKTNPLIAALYNTDTGETEPNAEPTVNTEAPKTEVKTEEPHDPRPATTAGRSLLDFASAPDEDGKFSDEGTTAHDQPKAPEEPNPPADEEAKPLTYKKRSAEPDDGGALPTFEAPKEPEIENVPAVDVDLSDEEKEHLAFAQFASANMEEFKGLDEKYTTFFKKHREYIDKQLSEDPDVEFNAENYDYQKFLERERPNLTPAQQKNIERTQIKHELREEFKADRAEEVSNLKQEVHEIKTKPELEASINSYTDSLFAVTPDDMKELLLEKGQEEAEKAFPIEFQVSSHILNTASQFGKELLNISNNITAYDPQGNPIHKHLGEFIEGQGQLFHKNGGSMRTREGKQFLPATKFLEAKAAGQSQNYWTFKDEDILDMLKEEAKKQIVEGVKSERARYEAYNGGAPVAAPVAPTAPSAPRSAPRSPTAPPPKTGENPVMNVLGY